jgi:hypothetical protein
MDIALLFFVSVAGFAAGGYLAASLDVYVAKKNLAAFNERVSNEHYSSVD